MDGVLVVNQNRIEENCPKTKEKCEAWNGSYGPGRRSRQKMGEIEMA